jgi:hypothetical protein
MKETGEAIASDSPRAHLAGRPKPEIVLGSPHREGFEEAFELESIRKFPPGLCRTSAGRLP